MDGVRELKICQVDDSDKVIINGVKCNIRERYKVENDIKWGILQIDDRKENIGVIFLNEGKKEEIVYCNTIEDRINILKRLVTDDFDYAITTYLGCKIHNQNRRKNRIIYDIYEKCEIEKLEDDKALSLISLLEYTDVKNYDKFRHINGMKIGELYLKFRNTSRDDKGVVGLNNSGDIKMRVLNILC